MAHENEKTPETYTPIDEVERRYNQRIAHTAFDLLCIFERHSDKVIEFSIEKGSDFPLSYCLETSGHNDFGQEILNRIQQDGHSISSAQSAFSKALDVASYGREVSFSTKGKLGVMTLQPRSKEGLLPA